MLTLDAEGDPGTPQPVTTFFKADTQLFHHLLLLVARNCVHSSLSMIPFPQCLFLVSSHQQRTIERGDHHHSIINLIWVYWILKCPQGSQCNSRHQRTPCLLWMSLCGELPTWSVQETNEMTKCSCQISLSLMLILHLHCTCRAKGACRSSDHLNQHLSPVATFQGP